MKKYQYYISMVLDDGRASEDRKATTLKEAKKELRVLRELANNSYFVKDCDSIELTIDRCKVEEVETVVIYEEIYYRKIK